MPVCECSDIFAASESTDETTHDRSKRSTVNHTGMCFLEDAAVLHFTTAAHENNLLVHTGKKFTSERHLLCFRIKHFSRGRRVDATERSKLSIGSSGSIGKATDQGLGNPAVMRLKAETGSHRLWAVVITRQEPEARVWDSKHTLILNIDSRRGRKVGRQKLGNSFQN